MKNYFIHRITGGNNASATAHQFMKQNILSIGWLDFSTDEFINDVKQNGVSAIENAYGQRGWGKPRNRFCLLRFIRDMKAGDIVIVPTWKHFSVYEISDDVVVSRQSPEIEIDDADWKIDLGFFRKVTPIATNIPRDDYAEQKLNSRLKIRQTNACITDLGDEVNRAVERKKQDKPINIKGDIIKDTEKLVLEHIQEKLHPNKFEELVEWYLKSIGGKEINTPAKNESPTEKGDADKVAIFEKLKVRVSVQAKHHKGLSGSWAVDQITSYASNKYQDEEEYTDILWVVSSCDTFSEDAISLARKNNVRLIDGHELARLIIENGIENLPL